ncbi:hypothetical protein OG410_01685 [Streptomyces sp. NBC_00659]|uniref:hypothetical protein n=1 Tax=Streptomyces sp. NBC_00659 TaxID=2903669 RepID=UPI002E2EB1AD|nr:hypothetical protein [Streptomyces sp. NBC_00659]
MTVNVRVVEERWTALPSVDGKAGAWLSIRKPSAPVPIDTDGENRNSVTLFAPRNTSACVADRELDGEDLFKGGKMFHFRISRRPSRSCTFRLPAGNALAFPASALGVPWKTVMFRGGAVPAPDS